MNFEIKEVTAIPCIEGEYSEENRQPALLVSERIGAEVVDTVVFGGYEVPATDEELENLWASVLPSEVDTDWETLETVRA